MKTSTFVSVVAAAAAGARAQDLNADCLAPNSNYCVSGSLGSNIIIRCDANKVATAGNCNDNLAGEPPVGVMPALCWESSATAGDAACEKNCVVYPDSGITSTLPADQCVPTFTASSSPAPSSTVTVSVSSAPPSSTPSSSTPASSTPASSVAVSTITTTTVLSSSFVVSTTVITSTATGTGTGGNGGSGGNGGGSGGNGGNGGGVSNSTTTVTGSASKSPIPPTTTSGPNTVPTGAADANRVGSALALVLGLAAVYAL